MAQTLPQAEEIARFKESSRATRESVIMAKLRRSEIEFLWDQFEDLIEDGKNEDANTKLELMKRVYQLLAKTMSKEKNTNKH